MSVFALRNEVWLPRPIDEVFEFFSDAYNLETLMPPILRFEVLTPAPIRMAAGTLIDYKLRLRGLPVRWQSEITVWEPPRRFVDEQRRGPYSMWVHEHTFEEKDGGTLAKDNVNYAVPGGALVNRLFVARDVRRIFEYRTERLLEALG
ncbi:MAG: SRPBCC family protein [Dehalococcoidia bacterium]|nr:SRPBCC family protein [Dehalococcoidia bacterium]